MFVSPENKIKSINRKSGFDGEQIIAKTLRFKSFQTVLSLGEGGMWFKRQGCEQALAAIFDPGFPPNLKLFGECMFGIHSIEYDQLKSFFYLFGVLENNRWWSWDEVEGLAKEHHLLLPPVIFRGRTTMKDVQLLLDERSRKLSALSTSQKPEGFVIRQVDGFHSSEFSKSIAKYVRPNHVQTGADWRRTWQKASLKRD